MASSEASSGRCWNGSGRELIVIEPLGGLGNQLFTYAVGLDNATRIGTELHVDLSNFRDYEWHDYELGSFGNSISGQIDRGLYGGKLQRLPGSRFIPWLKVASERSELFSPQFLRVPDGTRLRGYFQSWKYFESVGNLIQRQLWDVSNPSRSFLDKKAELQNGRPWVGVHVRLGNYQTIPSMGLAGREYYSRALGLLRHLGHHERVMVFTDSPDAVGAMGLFDSDDDWSFFEGDSTLSPLETMLLMSLSAHLVIGNSTFSWWAAWLGRDVPVRKVVYPRPWLDRSPRDDRDLPLPEWICLSRERHLLDEG